MTEEGFRQYRPALRLREDTAVFLCIGVEDVHERAVKVVLNVRGFKKLNAVRSVQYLVNGFHSLFSLLL